MRTALELWRYISLRGLKPLPKTSVSDWADTYRIISQGAAEPGRWRTSRAEYQREIMNAFTQGGIHRVVVKSSSQIGKSDIMNNVIARFAHLDPATIMMIQPTIDLAEDYSKSRISPMIRDTKVLNNLFFTVKNKNDVGVAKTRDSNNTILSKIFPGGRLIMCGANSPAGLASRPIRILLADEVDRFPPSAGTEGDPLDLAAKRMTTFWNRVMGVFSTPTIEGSSRIETEYLAGTQEEWQHECPNCNEYHTLRYINMDVESEESINLQGKKVVYISSVKWRCPDCGMSFKEKEMKATHQRYNAKNPEAIRNGIRSFFVNSFSSPWITWAEIMKEWMEAKGDKTREKVVVNTRFGEVYAEQGAFDDETVFIKRREFYGAELPEGVTLLTAAVDVQDNRLEYEVCGWGTGEECWGIIKGEIMGVPDQLTTWQALDDVLDRVYKFKNGLGLKISRTFIDSGGHYTGYVYQYCTNNYHKGRLPIKGKGGSGIPLVYKVATGKNLQIPLVLLGVNDGKQQVMNRLAINTEGRQYFHFPLDEEVMPYRGYDEFYFKGIISERKRRIKSRGIIQTIWEPTKGVRNEPLDLRVYNLAAMQSLKPDWEKLSMALTSDDVGESGFKRTNRPSNKIGKQKSRSIDIY